MWTLSRGRFFNFSGCERWNWDAGNATAFSRRISRDLLALSHGNSQPSNTTSTSEAFGFSCYNPGSNPGHIKKTYRYLAFAAAIFSVSFSSFLLFLGCTDAKTSATRPPLSVVSMSHPDRVPRFSVNDLRSEWWLNRYSAAFKNAAYVNVWLSCSIKFNFQLVSEGSQPISWNFIW